MTYALGRVCCRLAAWLRLLALPAAAHGPTPQKVEETIEIAAPPDERLGRRQGVRPTRRLEPSGGEERRQGRQRGRRRARRGAQIGRSAHRRPRRISRQGDVLLLSPRQAENVEASR